MIVQKEVVELANSLEDYNTNSKILYPSELVEAVLKQFGPDSKEYMAAIKGRYELGDLIENYLSIDNISQAEFIIAYEQGDDELWRYYQMFKQDESYRRIYNMWLEVMHADVDIFEEEYA